MNEDNGKALQQTFEKLVAAGWLKSVVTIDRKSETEQPAHEHNLQWTQKGRRRLMKFSNLISEIEYGSSPLTKEELAALRLISKSPMLGDGSGIDTDAIEEDLCALSSDLSRPESDNLQREVGHHLFQLSVALREHRKRSEPASGASKVISQPPQFRRRRRE